MSRGFGYLQRYLFQMLRDEVLPMTFAEIVQVAKPHAAGYRSHLERSMRRALRTLAKAGLVIPLGRGGPGDPRRYCAHPMFFGFAAGDPRIDELTKQFERSGWRVALNEVAV
jgi:hypothetical protein